MAKYLKYPNKFIEIALSKLDSEIVISSKKFNNLHSINEFIELIVKPRLIAKLKEDKKIYQPNKPYLRLLDNEINEDLINTFSQSLNPYIMQRIVIH